MAQRVGTTGSTVWVTDDDPSERNLRIYPEGSDVSASKPIGSVMAMSNGGFKFDPDWVPTFD